MAISTAAFDRIGIRVPPAVMERLVVEAIEQMLPPYPPPEPRRELTPEEAAALIRGGLSLEPSEAMGEAHPLVRSAAAYAAVIASSLTVPQAARKLGVDGSRVRQRLAARTLYGIKQPSGWRLPAFQFEGNALIPGIERVLPRLDADLHPLSVVHWFTAPNVDLFYDADETPVSPLDWLRLGLEPDTVATLADELAVGA